MGDIKQVDKLPVDLFSMTDRSDGVHVSSIIHDLCVTMERYKPSPANPRRLELGCAIEYAIAAACHRQYPGRFAHNLEIQHDGLYLTPDLIDWVPWEVWECKATWISLRDKGPLHDKFWAMWVQVMCYCYALGSNVGVLIIYFINGQYEKFLLGETRRRIWQRKFDDDELERNWSMILQHGKSMGVL